jgi:hypothetical protein
VREALKRHLFAGAYRAAERANARIQLEFVIRKRTELAAGREDVLRMLDARTVAALLGEHDRVAGYAEALAAEAAGRRAAGEEERATALEARALAIAREAERRSGERDPELEELIRGLEVREAGGGAASAGPPDEAV